jgi:hypothetical protein
MKTRKQAWNLIGSIRRKTRLNVSWLGMPCRNERNSRKNASFAGQTAPCPSNLRLHTKPRKARSQAVQGDRDGRCRPADPPDPQSKRKMRPWASPAFNPMVRILFASFSKPPPIRKRSNAIPLRENHKQEGTGAVLAVFSTKLLRSILENLTGCRDQRFELRVHRRHLFLERLEPARSGCCYCADRK